MISDHFILCLTLTNNEDAIIHYVTLCVFLNWKGRKGLFIIVFTHTIVLRIPLIKLQLKRRESTEKYRTLYYPYLSIFLNNLYCFTFQLYKIIFGYI